VLTKLTVKNFKQFGHVEIELGNPVVFIGPNNSGKSTALQALALWNVGHDRWTEKRGGKAPGKRPGVTINRRDLIAVPVPDANLLWRELHVRDVQQRAGKPITQNVRIDILVEGITQGKEWACGFEFDYANEESFYCRPLRLSEEREADRMPVPREVSSIDVAYLPPMSGLADREFAKAKGEVNYLIGQGRTAEVLRNLCFQVAQGANGNNEWKRLKGKIEQLFGVDLEAPVYISERAEISLAYRNQRGTVLDLSSAGRGLQQTLLLLAYMTVHRGSVLLLDEPDAHLEILRQRQVYELLTETAKERDTQIIAASHSEVLLNEAADRDVVIAFVGKPHRIDDRGNQLLKSLKEIGFEQYYQAEQTGWVLYLEGSTDLAILRAFAKKLGHPAAKALQQVFVHYVLNKPTSARTHFYGLSEAKPDLVGFALFDRIDQQLQERPELAEYMWKRREIENYLCTPEVLIAYADASAAGIGPLLEAGERAKRREVMEQCIADLIPRVAMNNRGDRWWVDTKASDDFLDRLFSLFFEKLQLPNLMRKTDYHALAEFIDENAIPAEVGEVLDRIAQTVGRAHPVGS
jgi:predicted ATPase